MKTLGMGILLAILFALFSCASFNKQDASRKLSPTSIRVGMSFQEADARLSEKFGNGGWYLAMIMPEKNWGWKEYAMDDEGYKILDISYFPTDGNAKVMSIRLWALSRHGKMFDTSFLVTELDLDDL